MTDQAQNQNPNSTPAVGAIARKFYTVEISGDRKHVQNYGELLEEQLRAVVDFMNGLVQEAAPRTKNIPLIQIHVTQAE